MSIKYWEFEDAPLKEKLKSPRISDIAKVFFDNDTAAYRFALLLTEVKKRGSIKLKEVPEQIPVSTAARYLNFAVEIGMLKHENEAYMLTDRYTRPLRNLAAYMKAWAETPTEEDVEVLFINARVAKQVKRGGKINGQKEEAQPAEQLREQAREDRTEVQQQK